MNFHHYRTPLITSLYVMEVWDFCILGTRDQFSRLWEGVCNRCRTPNQFNDDQEWTIKNGECFYIHFQTQFGRFVWMGEATWKSSFEWKGIGFGGITRQLGTLPVIRMESQALFQSTCAWRISSEAWKFVFRRAREGAPSPRFFCGLVLYQELICDYSYSLLDADEWGFHRSVRSLYDLTWGFWMNQSVKTLSKASLNLRVECRVVSWRKELRILYFTWEKLYPQVVSRQSLWIHLLCCIIFCLHYYFVERLLR